MRKARRFLGLGALALLGWPACQGVAQAPRLQRLSAAERTLLQPALEKKPLPGGAKFVYPDLDQSFTLLAGVQRKLFLVPVVYVTQGDQPGQGLFRNCGVYTIGADRKIHLITTLGPEMSGETRCDGIKAVGLQPRDGAMPRVLLIYGVSSPSVSLQFGAVLCWDQTQQQYTLDEAATSDFGGPSGEPLSIREMQKQLAGK